MTTHRNDVDIKKDILAELAWTPDVMETEIGVIVKDGAVTLPGTVPYYSHKAAAERASKRIRGVRALVDQIEVKIALERAGSDEDIAQHIARMVEWSAMVNADKIEADVRKGVVTLNGELDWQFERNFLQTQVASIKGVKAVWNNITLRKCPVALDLKAKITSALQRQAKLEAHHISVLVEGTTVTLTGNVNSYSEHDLIEATAWAAPGVTKVIDHVTVDDVFAVAA